MYNIHTFIHTSLSNELNHKQFIHLIVDWSTKRNWIKSLLTCIPHRKPCPAPPYRPQTPLHSSHTTTHTTHLYPQTTNVHTNTHTDTTTAISLGELSEDKFLDTGCRSMLSHFCRCLPNLFLFIANSFSSSLYSNISFNNLSSLGSAPSERAL